MSRSQLSASQSGDRGQQQGGVGLDLDGEQLNHIPPTVHHLLTLVTRLNLAHNSFVEVPALDGLASLQALSLAHNSIRKVSLLILPYYKK